MKMLGKLFVAFCVATVIAQMIIAGMAAAKGNLSLTALYKGLALVNGIDITGDKLQKMLDDARSMPNPKYEDVEEERARQDKDLALRERAIRLGKEQLDALQIELQAREASFERRTSDFYEVLDQQEAKLLNEGLTAVQQTLESLPADQAKEQLLMMEENGHLEDVVAIFKGMSSAKRSKIMGEFTNAAKQEPETLQQILMRMRAGEPKRSLIDNARNTAAQ